MPAEKFLRKTRYPALVAHHIGGISVTREGKGYRLISGGLAARAMHASGKVSSIPAMQLETETEILAATALENLMPVVPFGGRPVANSLRYWSADTFEEASALLRDCRSRRAFAREIGLSEGSASRGVAKRTKPSGSVKAPTLFHGGPK